jgi:NADH dehydrogenase [ubiquinone] 1 alpha subcomplex assembly factor 7
MLLEKPVPGLKERLAARIASEGPLTVEAYMQACLSDDAHGVYAAQQPIGAAGHFITAPEISQIFGELIGLWAVSVWQRMGEPRPLTVIELGPGRGTLLADAIRAWRVMPRFLEAVWVALVETSPRLTAIQRETLDDVPVPLQWHANLEDVPKGPAVLIANEFIDALPIRQFVRRGDAWRERLVASGDAGGFVIAESALSEGVEGLLAAHTDRVPEGAIVECRPAMKHLLHAMATRSNEAPLAALIVDYGHDASGFGDTLQAVRQHKYADPLAEPGSADLTAHVDFAELKRLATELGLKTYGPMPQGAFLLRLGLEIRRDRLLAAARPEHREAIASGAARLMDPEQMGVLFKVVAFASPELAPPPPFADPDFPLSSPPSTPSPL